MPCKTEYKEYEYKEYHEEKPDCGPDQFPELRNSCIDPHSGEHAIGLAEHCQRQLAHTVNADTLQAH